MSAEIEEQADIILNAIEKGKIERADGTISLSYTPEQALQVLDAFKNDGSFEFTLTTETEYSFLGQRLDVGETEITLKDISLIDNAELVRKAFVEAQKSRIENVDIRLKYKNSLEKYCCWIRESIERNL